MIGGWLRQGTFMRKFHRAFFFCALIASTPAFAARCGGDFNTFVQDFSAEATAAGVSPRRGQRRRSAA